MGSEQVHVTVNSLPEREIKIVCLDETYMYFKYKLIRMKDHEARHYSNTKNRFIAVLRSAMRREAEKKVFLAIELLKNYREIEKDIKAVIKNMDAIDFFLEISAAEREEMIKIIDETENRGDVMLTLSQELKKRGFEKGRLEGKIEGKIEGKLEAKLEAAEAMLKEKMSLEKIAKITSLPLEEINKLAAKNKQEGK